MDDFFLLRLNFQLLQVITDVRDGKFYRLKLPSEKENTAKLNLTKTKEFIFKGINMFWARLRLILARAAGRGFK